MEAQSSDANEKIFLLINCLMFIHNYIDSDTADIVKKGLRHVAQGHNDRPRELEMDIFNRALLWT